MSAEQIKCPVCDGAGKYKLRIGELKDVKCQRCEGTGQKTSTVERKEDSPSASSSGSASGIRAQARVNGIKEIQRLCEEALDHGTTWRQFCQLVENRLEIETALMPKLRAHRPGGETKRDFMKPDNVNEENGVQTAEAQPGSGAASGSVAVEHIKHALVELDSVEGWIPHGKSAASICLRRQLQLALGSLGCEPQNSALCEGGTQSAGLKQ